MSEIEVKIKMIKLIISFQVWPL